MCTVTFIPFPDNNFILTSSRDVPYSREKAVPPQYYKEDEVLLEYPKDGKAGGTWIGHSSKLRLICLLNGGFQYHESAENYRKSRGIIVLELLKAADINRALKEIDLVNIEPFTLVIVEWDFGLFLFEFVWDGRQKHFRIVPNEPCIWSSATLYDEKTKAMREAWFSAWQKDFGFSEESIAEFHRKAGVGIPAIDVLMNRGEGGTVSITKVVRKAEKVEMSYQEIA